MKIIRLKAERVKRINAIDITPKGHIVEITGKNGAGKTSVLDAIYWSLADARSHQSEPIKRGEKTAQVTLDLGKLKVTRRFRRTKPKKEGVPERITTSLFVETPEGARYGSPQAMLDALIGPLSLDPMAFLRMKSGEQYEALRKLAGLDFSETEIAIGNAFSDRRKAKAEANRNRSAAAMIEVPQGTPDEPVSVADLLVKLRKAERHNDEIDRAISERSDMHEDVATLRETAAGQRAKAARLRADADALDSSAEANERDATEAEDSLKAMPDISDPKDTDAIESEIRSADATNRNVASRKRKAELESTVKSRTEDAEALTKRIEDLRNRIKSDIEAAEMPVDGLSLRDGMVTYRDLPFDQASDAVQLQVSCAMAMARDAKLRVIRVRDGSLLDSESMAVLEKMAAERNYQVWIEVVDESGERGWVIEDGNLISTPEARESESEQGKLDL